MGSFQCHAAPGAAVGFGGGDAFAHRAVVGRAGFRLGLPGGGLDATGEITLRIGDELRPAAGTAEVTRRSGMLEGVGCAFDRHRHAADRIDGLLRVRPGRVVLMAATMVIVPPGHDTAPPARPSRIGQSGRLPP